jgi:hypothetical protein
MGLQVFYSLFSYMGELLLEQDIEVRPGDGRQ